jgi:comEA protein
MNKLHFVYFGVFSLLILFLAFVLIKSELPKEEPIIYIRETVIVTESVKAVTSINQDYIQTSISEKEMLPELITGGTSQLNSTTLINLNTASKSELMELKGIGEVIADRIIEYREQNSGFKSLEEIMEVKGIGEKIFSNMQDRITID